MLADKDDYMMALAKAHTDTKSFELMEALIDAYFSLIQHMKETSLYDVFEYEKRFANQYLEPMRILAHDNEKLKREVNKLRRELGKIEKYKETDACIT